MTDHTPLTTEQLTDIEARVNAATKGPWTLSDEYSDILSPDGTHLASYWHTADGKFMAQARTDVPALLAEVRRLQQQRKYLLAQLAKRDAESGRGDAALRDFLGEQPAEETHVVADDSGDPEHVDDCPDPTAALRPLAAIIENAIQTTPIRLGTDDWGTCLAAQLLADVAAYMGRILGPDARILAEVQAERDRQDAKWGEQNHPDGTGGSGALYVADRYRTVVDHGLDAGTATWRDIVLEEVYEALAESDPARLRAELIQVAAVATAWAAAIDRRTPAAAAAAGESGSTR